jgi:hypothetical protein
VLFVCINNRISIRDASVDGRAVSIIRSQAVALPGAAPPGVAAASAEFELEKVPHSFKDCTATVDQDQGWAFDVWRFPFFPPDYPSRSTLNQQTALAIERVSRPKGDLVPRKEVQIFLFTNCLRLPHLVFTGLSPAAV